MYLSLIALFLATVWYLLLAAYIQLSPICFNFRSTQQQAPDQDEQDSTSATRFLIAQGVLFVILFIIFHVFVLTNERIKAKHAIASAFVGIVSAVIALVVQFYLMTSFCNKNDPTYRNALDKLVPYIFLWWSLILLLSVGIDVRTRKR